MFPNNIQTSICPYCGGDGEILSPAQWSDEPRMEKCPQCLGRGYVQGARMGKGDENMQREKVYSEIVCKVLQCIPYWYLTTDRQGHFPQVLIEAYDGPDIVYLLGYADWAAHSIGRLQHSQAEPVLLFSEPGEGRRELRLPGWDVSVYIESKR